MSENQPQWQPTNPPTPPVQQQSWFARNKVLSIVLGAGLVIVLCCCGGGILAMSGDTEDSSSAATSEESTESTTDTAEDETSDPSEETDDSAKESSTSSSEPTKETETPAETSEESEDSSEDFSTEEKNAISAAENYLDFMPFSKKGLIQQLSSDAGDGYPKEVAETAVEHIESDVDWNEQATKAAENYQDLMPMSRSELINQLSSDAGDGFTKEQAEHAANEVGL